MCPPSLSGFLLGYSLFFSGMAPAFFYALLARFPASSPIDRRLPWLKRLLVVAGAAVFVPVAAWTLVAGSQWPAARALTRAGAEALDRGLLGYVFLGLGLGLYEPVHGSAPSLAGKNVANPIGAILSVAMMLRQSFGLMSEAADIEAAVGAALGEGARTRDLVAIGGINPVLGYNESMAVELEDGSVMVNARAYDGVPTDLRAVMVYPFNAQGNISMTSGYLDPQLVTPTVASSIIRYGWAKDGKGILLFSGPNHPRLRVNMTVRLSRDDGKTWSDAKTIDPGPAAYSDMVVQNDGLIGLLYERGNEGGIYYTSFSLGWLEE